MRAANSIWPVLVGLAAAAAACRPAQEQEQDAAAENRAAGPTEIEALPPDESVATSDEELANGDQASNGNAAANAY